MLTSLRNATKSWVAAVFIFALAGSFAIWGVGDWIGGVLVSDVATIGDKKITQVDYRRAYDAEIQRVQRRFGRVIARDQARLLGIDQRVLGTLLGTAAMELHSEELKLGVGDGAVAARIARDPAFQSVGGGFDADRFRQTLQLSNISEGDFVEGQRRGLLRAQLTQTITGGVTVPSTMLKAFNRFQNETRAVDYLIVTPKLVGEIKAPDATDLRKFYDENESQFTAPQYRKVAAIVLKPEDFRAGIVLTDEDLKVSYEARANEFNTREKRTVEQITFADEAAARKAHEELKGGKDFDKLADEQGREDRYISYGSVPASGILDKKISDAAFALDKPSFSGPINGSLSTAIVRVSEITPASSKSLDEVRDQLRRELAGERAASLVADHFDDIEDDRAKGLSLEDIGSKRDLNVIVVPAIDAQGKSPDGALVTSIPANPVLYRNIFAAEVDLQSEPVELTQESFAWYEVQDIIAEKLKPFESVKDTVNTAWVTAETRSAVSGLARDLVKRIKSGATIADIATEKGIEARTAKDLKRASRTDDLASGAVGQIFTLAKGSIASANLPGGTQRVVFIVKDITLPGAPSESVRTSIANAITAQLGEEMVTQYLADLQARYNVEVDRAAIEQATSAAGPAGQRGLF